jgi:hypothetical protein
LAQRREWEGIAAKAGVISKKHRIQDHRKGL